MASSSPARATQGVQDMPGRLSKTLSHNSKEWAGWMAQQWRAPAALTEDLGSVPRTHVMDPVPENLMPFPGLSRRCVHLVHTHLCT